MRRRVPAALLALALLSLGSSGCDGSPLADVQATAFPRDTPVAQAALARFDVDHKRILRGTPDVHGVLGDSPIDIRIGETRRFQSPDPDIRYAPFPLARVKHTGDNLKVYASGDSHITIGGKRYDLAQFHFHRSSEHAIQGRRAPMEVHLVHVASDGAIAVIGSMIERGPASRALQVVWDLAPSSPSEVSSTAMFDPRQLLPGPGTPYFTYSGSLTTPPFTNGLTWIVQQQPIRLSAEQLRAYAHLFEEEDARALQPLGERTVYERVGGMALLQGGRGRVGTAAVMRRR
jgi:carbonic anhydrase